MNKTYQLHITVLLIAIAMGCTQSGKNENSLNIAKNHNEKNFDKRVDEKEANFIVETIAGNYAEVKLARLALNKSTNPEVKELAKTLEADHAKIIQSLKGLANKKGIAIPLEESPKAKKEIITLSTSNEEKFNKQWCDLLADKHKKTIRKFENTWAKTDDLDLRNWINETLPGLKDHQEQLESCDKNL